MNSKFSEILKDLIDTHHKEDGTKFSMEEIGVAIGYSGAYIRKLLNGQSRPGYEVVEKLARFFGVDPNFLHGWTLSSKEEEIKKIENQIAFRKTDVGVTSPDIGDMLRKIADLIDGETQHESDTQGEEPDKRPPV